MKDKKLTATIANLQRVLADPELKPWQQERLRKGLRELKKFKRQGRLDPRKVFLVTDLLASTLFDERSSTVDASTYSKTTDRALQK